jgi:hypothetical protein
MKFSLITLNFGTSSLSSRIRICIPKPNLGEKEKVNPRGSGYATLQMSIAPITWIHRLNFKRLHLEWPDFEGPNLERPNFLTSELRTTEPQTIEGRTTIRLKSE